MLSMEDLLPYLIKFPKPTSSCINAICFLWNHLIHFELCAIWGDINETKIKVSPLCLSQESNHFFAFASLSNMEELRFVWFQSVHLYRAKMCSDSKLNAILVSQSLCDYGFHETVGRLRSIIAMATCKLVIFGRCIRDCHAIYAQEWGLQQFLAAILERLEMRIRVIILFMIILLTKREWFILTVMW